MQNQPLNLARSIGQAVQYAASHLIELSIIGGTVGGYKYALSNFVYDAMNGRMTAIDLQRAMKALIRTTAPEAFEQGLRDGGLAGDELEAAADEHRSMITQFIASQVSHVNSFASVAAAVQGDAGKQAAVLSRLDQWADAIRGLAEQASALAQGDPMLMFDGEDGSETCADCQKYKGKLHRRSWWVKRGLVDRNGNPNFDCGRWDNCHHHFYNTKGELVVT